MRSYVKAYSQISECYVWIIVIFICLSFGLLMFPIMIVLARQLALILWEIYIQYNTVTETKGDKIIYVLIQNYNNVIFFYSLKIYELSFCSFFLKDNLLNWDESSTYWSNWLKNWVDINSRGLKQYKHTMQCPWKNQFKMSKWFFNQRIKWKEIY